MQIGKGSIYTRYPNDAYRDNYERTFGRKEQTPAAIVSDSMPGLSDDEAWDEQWSVIAGLYVDGYEDDRL